MIKVLKSVVVGPLEPYAAGFATELERQGYTAGTAEKQVALAAHLSRWLAAAGTGARRPYGADSGAVCVSSPGCWLCGLPVGARAGAAAGLPARAGRGARGGASAGDAGAGAAGAVPALPGVRARPRRRRPPRATRASCGRSIAARLGPGGPGLEGLTAADVTAFVVASCPGMPKGSAKMTVTALRSLLGWLHVDGVLSQSLAWAVPSVAAWRLARLPQPLDPGQVPAMLASCDRAAGTAAATSRC